MNEGQRQLRLVESRPNIGTVATVNVLGYCGTLDRSLDHLRDIHRSTYYDILELLSISSHRQPEHRLTTAITASQCFICGYVNPHQLRTNSLLKKCRNQFYERPGNVQNYI